MARSLKKGPFVDEKLLKKVVEIGNHHNIQIVNFGHAGNGNIHVNLILDSEQEKNLIKDFC